jgi:hypothetical protein
MKRQYHEVPAAYLRGPGFHKNKLELRTFIFWASFVLTMACLTIAPLRYLAYGVPLLVLLSCVADRSIQVGDETKPFLIILVAGLVLGPLANTDGWKDLFFIFAGVSVAFLSRLPRIKLWTVFLALLACFVFQFVAFGSFRGGLQFNVLKSESSFEGNFSFVFALLVPFAVMQRRYVLALLSLVFAVVSLKRIAVLAALTAGLMALLGPKLGKRLLNPPVMLALNAFVLIVNMAYTSGAMDYWIQHLTGQSPNEFGQGRQSIHRFVVRDLLDAPFHALIGHGMGSVYTIAEAGFGAYEKINLHSDLLKLSYEVGYIVTALTIWTMYTSRHYSLRVAFLFLNVLFFTDNTLIYFFLTFLLFTLMRVQRESEQANEASRVA